MLISEIYANIYNSATMTTYWRKLSGFKDNNILLMPFGDLSGIGPNNHVAATGNAMKVKVGNSLCGRVLDALGNPMDGLGELDAKDYYP